MISDRAPCPANVVFSAYPLYACCKLPSKTLAKLLFLLWLTFCLPYPSYANHFVTGSFPSQVDGKPDFYAFSPARVTQHNQALAIFLHGMGGSYLEPFKSTGGTPLAQAIGSQFPALHFLSVSYGRDASWGNDPAIVDLNENIRAIMRVYPIGRIILIGSSMGGSVALTYAAEAPADIKSKISGVVSVESTGDLSALFRRSSLPSVAAAMAKAFGGPPDAVPEVYRRKSFLHNLDKFPSNTPVFVVSAKSDSIVPPDMQKSIVKALRKARVPVKLAQIEGGHGAPGNSLYLEALEFVLRPLKPR